MSRRVASARAANTWSASKWGCIGTTIRLYKAYVKRLQRYDWRGRSPLPQVHARRDAGVLPAVRGGREPRGPSEQPPEEGRILVAHLVADVVDAGRARFQQVARRLHAEAVHVLHRLPTGGRCESPGERPRQEPGLSRHRGHRIGDRVVT